MSPYGDVIPIETITTNTTFNNSRFPKPCDSDLKYSKPCDGMTHIALCFATSFRESTKSITPIHIKFCNRESNVTTTATTTDIVWSSVARINSNVSTDW